MPPRKPPRVPTPRISFLLSRHTRTQENRMPAAQPAARPAIWPLQKDCLAFYGDPRRAGWLHANTVDVPCPWALRIGNVTVRNIVIHKKCADSLTRVLGNI